ncbi:MAG TPA: sigma-70 family RNA polymerase sigma factor [Nocardioides sp.]|uniref:sigma-70 family RNA polymerase sigma factor n=1 Tax=uncultured Nocardioides sp. TaxID=198441 RepID=UPI000EC0B6DF|nr:sigma-70 family RNA polymerase sigma factor [uncultured Nocardioides sp.]HCB04532.1 RNA polymerase subunit sigma-70 [Nocardioides sp.]HRD60481.1 sigma-70 family RNA polymerase sigma factor [Nocardioides sp.]HRI94452.1 sigma-70 family RNA polymerase sigma factor [Nocardioides sp.]HRK45519.1 sigma-70 family RNA polymerase sigma factor [Nocardioides sp.]
MPTATANRPSAAPDADVRDERSELTHELLEAARNTTDARERERLLDEVILANRRVAESVANRYRGRGVSIEDLHQAAYEGLVKAVHRFDVTVRPDLLTYAVPTIRGEVQRWFRDHSWMVRPPRRIQELQWRIGRSTDHLAQDLGREPTHAEISEDAGCTRAELDEALGAYGCFSPPSLDRPVRTEGDAIAGEVTLGEVLPGEDTGCSAAEARAILQPVLRRLPERDRRIVYLRYFENHSQREIGDDLGVSQMQVSRLLDRIIRDLREEIA